MPVPARVRNHFDGNLVILFKDFFCFPNDSQFVKRTIFYFFPIFVFTSLSIQSWNSNVTTLVIISTPISFLIPFCCVMRPTMRRRFMWHRKPEFFFAHIFLFFLFFSFPSIHSCCHRQSHTNTSSQNEDSSRIRVNNKKEKTKKMS